MSKTEIPANTPPAIAPTLQSAPHVTEAPGRGIIPNVSQHTAAIPLLYQLDARPFRDQPITVDRMQAHAQPEPPGGVVERSDGAPVNGTARVGRRQLGKRLAHADQPLAVTLVVLSARRNQAVSNQPVGSRIWRRQLVAWSSRVARVQE